MPKAINFCQMEIDISVRLKWTNLKAGTEDSGRTKPKWSIPFDVPTEMSGILDWMESPLVF